MIREAKPLPSRRLLHAAQLIMMLGLLAIAAGTAQADVAPNGQIAYTVCGYSNGEVVCDIWVMNADGTGQTNITNTPTISETDPVWSADSSKIAFVSAEDIWTMNADGTSPQNVTNSPSWQFGPTWAPAGDRLAFVRSVPGEVISTQFDILVINVDGSGLVNITNSDADELDPAWSPNGLRIAFAAVRQTEQGGGGDWEIVTANPDGTGELNLTASLLGTQEDRAPTWSANSTMVAFMSQYDATCCGDWEIWGVNSDGTGITNLTNSPGSADWYPCWSPDGAFISFSSNRDAVSGGEFDIYSIPAPTVLPPQAAAPGAALLPTPATRLTTTGDTSNPAWGRLRGSNASSVGVTVSTSGAWFLRNSNSGGAADLVFGYGAPGTGFVRLSGDWDGNGTHTPGLYDPSSGAFFLKNTNAGGGADLVFSFGAGGAGFLPLVGDWNGDGIDTIGLYGSTTGVVFLRNTNGSGPANVTFSFGPAGGGLLPITGDWNGDRIDTIGLYVPTTGAFFLRNTNTNGGADIVFTYGASQMKPVAGDWNGDGRDSIGVYESGTGAWFLRNLNSPGSADLVFTYGPPMAVPMTGDWDGL